MSLLMCTVQSDNVKVKMKSPVHHDGHQAAHTGFNTLLQHVWVETKGCGGVAGVVKTPLIVTEVEEI